MNPEASRWRDDTSWEERLARDRAVLKRTIGDEGLDTLAEVVHSTSALGEPDFIVVFGSRARKQGRDGSDVDLCFEASWVPSDPERMPRIRERQDKLVFDMLAFPRGLLLGRLRVRDEIARAVLTEGRVYLDRGPYREIAIAADEEQLLGLNE